MGPQVIFLTVEPTSVHFNHFVEKMPTQYFKYNFHLLGSFCCQQVTKYDAESKITRNDCLCLIHGIELKSASVLRSDQLRVFEPSSHFLNEILCIRVSQN